MNRVTRGTVVLAAALVLLSCEGDPTGDLRNGADHLVATPSALFLDSDDTTAVLVEVLDKQGNRLEASWSIANVDQGLFVERDTLYNLVYDNDGNQVQPKKWPRARYYVSATSNTGDLTFTVSAGGKSIVIPVRLVPANLAVAAFSTQNVAAYTDTISATLTPPFVFTSASAVTFSGVTPSAHKVRLSADSSTIFFVPPPGMTAKTAAFNHVRLGYGTADAGEFTVTSGTDAVTTLPIPPITVSKTVAAIGDTIMLNAPAGWRFTPGASVPTVGTAGLFSLGVSADSLSLRFLIGPNATTTVAATNLRISGATGLGVKTLTSTTTLTTPVVSNFASTVTTSTPAASQAVTLTITDPAFRFRPTAVLTHGAGNGTTMPIIARAADSTSITFISTPGATAGSLFADGIILVALPQVPINDLPSTATVTPPAPYAGTGTFATAPVVTMPGVGGTGNVVDVGSFNGSSDCRDVNPGGWDCRIYTFTIGAPVTLSFSNRWGNTTDLGLYFDDVGNTDPFTHACDSRGAGSGGQPEVCSVTFAPGTYFMQMTTYHPFYGAPNNVAPPWFWIAVTGS